jgi:hypothetical protein
VNRDQKKQIATITTTLASILISGFISVFFDNKIGTLVLLVVIFAAITLYYSAILVLEGETESE